MTEKCKSAALAKARKGSISSTVESIQMNCEKNEELTMVVDFRPLRAGGEP